MKSVNLELVLPEDVVDLLSKQAAELLLSNESYAEKLLAEGVMERRNASGNVVPIGRRKTDRADGL